MSENGSLEIKLKPLDALRAAINTGTYARVGVVGDTAARKDSGNEGITNAEIGLINEFGSVENNIPARSWLRFPMFFKEREIAQYVKSPTIMSLLMAGQVTQAFQLLGIFGESIVQEGFETRGFGQWKPNKPSTIARKGSSAPLIDTSQLRRAVSSDVVQS